jgi:hypothetical protein
MISTSRDLCFVAMLLLAGWASPVWAQGINMGVWDLRLPGKPGCPGITFQIARTNNMLGGAAWTGGREIDDMPKISKVQGQVGDDGNFTFTLTPLEAGAPQGAVSGHSELATAEVITSNYQRGDVTMGR